MDCTHVGYLPFECLKSNKCRYTLMRFNDCQIPVTVEHTNDCITKYNKAKLNLDVILEGFCSQGLVKSVSRKLPKDILPNGYSAELTDYSIKSRQSDDKLYRTDHNLRRYVTRGLSLLILEQHDGTKTEEYAIYSNRKFMGITDTDEDHTLDHDGEKAKEPLLSPQQQEQSSKSPPLNPLESSSSSSSSSSSLLTPLSSIAAAATTTTTSSVNMSEDNSNSRSDTDQPGDGFFLENTSGVSNVIAVEKVNGEAAHFSGRYIGDRFYFIAGSKNVHLVFQKSEDVDKYTEDRYQIARRVAHALYGRWSILTDHAKLILQNFLHATRVTVVCELMMHDHQHVVYFGDNFKKDQIVILALTSPPEIEPESLTALPSRTTRRMFSNLGFNVLTIHGECKSVAQLQQHQIKTRGMLNSEGIVYYYENPQGHTYGMLKAKSKWYVHVRALRQQASYRYNVRKKKKPTLEASKNRSRQRMESLKEYMGTERTEILNWQKISDSFFDWLDQQDREASSSFSPLTIRDNFAVLWKQFTTTHPSIVFAPDALPPIEKLALSPE